MRSTADKRRDKLRADVDPDSQYLSPVLSAWFLFIVTNAAALGFLTVLSPQTLHRVSGGLTLPDEDYLRAMWLLLGAAACGGLLALIRPRGVVAHRPFAPGRVAGLGRRTADIALLASGVLFAKAVLQGLSPQVIVAVCLGSPPALAASRAALAPLPGVTTLTALAPVAVAILVVRRGRMGTADRARVALLLSFGLARAVLNAERLALIEVLVALVIGLAWRDPSKLRKRVSSSLVALPALAVSLFIAGESIRPSYTVGATSGSGLVSYGSDRLAGYYSSALVNGFYYRALVPDRPAPNFTADMVWNAPGIYLVATPESLYGFDSRGAMSGALSTYLNPELNTVSLLPAIGAEWGLVGGSLVLLALGWGLVRLHFRIRTTDPLGAALYAMLLIGALESARYCYFAQARFWVAVAVIALLSAMASRSRPEATST